MTGRHTPSDFIHQPRRDRMYEAHVQDPYMSRSKLSEPTVCPGCKAVYHKGHWQWGDAPADAHEHRCPACQRMHDHMPAGTLTVGGEFFAAHREEIMHLIHNLETKEKAEHALERIMDINDETDGVTINFTGSHLTRGTGEALHHAYQGELKFHFTDKDDAMQASWRR